MAPVTLSHNSYGKSSIRLVKVSRLGDRHDLSDLTVDVRFEGQFEAAYSAGDNQDVLPTDTMKNTVYALARSRPAEPPESFGLVLSDHFLSRDARVESVHVGFVERPWARVETSEGVHRHAFVSSGAGVRTASVLRTRAGVTVEGGIDQLRVLRTSGSAFSGFKRDEYTTLPETRDRLFATIVRAKWTYESADADFKCWSAVRHALITTFADHESESVQHTAYAMGEAVLDRVPSIEAINLVLPNVHHVLIDLRPFQLENPNEVFVATTEPHGVIEATVRRT